VITILPLDEKKNSASGQRECRASVRRKRQTVRRQLIQSAKKAKEKRPASPEKKKESRSSYFRGKRERNNKHGRKGTLDSALQGAEEKKEF